MTNFCNYPKYWEPIKEVTLSNIMDKGAKPTVIGLWGFKDFDNVELVIVREPVIHVEQKQITGNGLVRLYELSSYIPGRHKMYAATKKDLRPFTEDFFVNVPSKKSEEKGEWGGESSMWPQDKKIRSMHPNLRPMVTAVLDRLRERGFRPRIFYGWRSVAVQRQLKARGASQVDFSFHNAQLRDGTPNSYAADIVDERWNWGSEAEANGFWDALGEEAKAEGLVWGGNWTGFRDVAHVQLVPNSELGRVKRESGL
jgi:hypothetical protein